MTISVNIIADSISPDGVRLTTFVLEYPRYIHAEVMTHRVFSRNAQSSRAIPVNRSLEQTILSPIVWGENKSGMSSEKELSVNDQKMCAYYWHAAARTCQDFAERLAKVGLHKQWSNRMLEWFSPIKVVVTATEWDNFFWLRDDPDVAQPEIVDLARQMKDRMDNSTPQLLQPGQWHLPYVNSVVSNGGMGQNIMVYYVRSEGAADIVDLETAKKVSAGCCAAVSYRNNPTIEKCLEIWDKLFSGPKPHLSPVEHQATPMLLPNQYSEISNLQSPKTWQIGITHSDRGGNLWSGNLRGFIQLRQTL